MHTTCKQKNAFKNCCVCIVRLKDERTNIFKEYHVKIFNTGKIEIPGSQDEINFRRVLQFIIEILEPIMKRTGHWKCDLAYKKQISEMVLINSGFYCGYYINRDVCYRLLKTKYNIHCVFDPCSYPGIQCSFYYDLRLTPENQTGHAPVHSKDILIIKKKIKYIYHCHISCMIFRTGSCLIVGKCDEFVLKSIYEFLKNFFKDEYMLICQNPGMPVQEIKKKIPKKCKLIKINYNNLCGK